MRDPDPKARAPQFLTFPSFAGAGYGGASFYRRRNAATAPATSSSRLAGSGTSILKSL